MEGTAHVLDLCRTLSRLRRLQYVSTCYVSGRYDGAFTEEMLDEGQTFLNHYESTKFEAELLVRKAMADGVPATVYRPGIVVGDSTTGQTQKYDGPYFLAAFLRRQPAIALVPAVGDADSVVISLVPRDFVISAMDGLSVLDRTVGRTFALTDPNPPTVRELVDLFAGHLGKRVVWARLPLGFARATLGSVPGLERLLGIPAEGLDYFASRTRAPGCPARRSRATPTPCSTTWSPTRSTRPRRWSDRPTYRTRIEEPDAIDEATARRQREPHRPGPRLRREGHIPGPWDPHRARRHER